MDFGLCYFCTPKRMGVYAFLLVWGLKIPTQQWRQRWPAAEYPLKREGLGRYERVAAIELLQLFF